MAETACVVYWFHPLVWMAAKQLRRESELACDDEVLRMGVPAREYASELLELARISRGGFRSWSAALAMARPSQLERRIKDMFDRSVDRRGITESLRRWGAVMALSLVVPLAAMRLAAEGVGETKALDAKNTSLANAVNSKSTGLPASQEAKAGRIQVPGEEQSEKLVKKVPPVYPQAAKKAGVQGAVNLHVVIAADGTPEKLEVINPEVDSRLAESAISAVRQWRYKPTLVNGKPVEVETKVVVTYSLLP